MTTIWIPSDNRDHEVELVDPGNPRTWKVIKGNKTLAQLMRENIDSTTRRDPLTPAERTKAKSHYRI